MWYYISRFILRNRLALLIGLALVTIFMGYRASQVQLSYEFARVLPLNDTNYINYTKFTENFGEDGTIMAVGIEDKDIFKLQHYNDWYDLTHEIRKLEGVEEVLSIANLYTVFRNDSFARFDFVPLIKSKPKSQTELDSIKEKVMSLVFYDKFLLNRTLDFTLMAISFSKGQINTEARIAIVDKIKKASLEFGTKHNIPVHLSGLPYIRTAISSKVASELILFLILGVCVTALILLIFFRSFNVVFFSMMVVLIGVIWSLGTINLLGYKITLLTGLIPPLIIIIGIPNSIFLLNKYQLEFKAHGNRIKALRRAISKAGVTTLLANINTAIGFGVFYFTDSELLVEFGSVAAINILATYVISLIVIPSVFSFLPPPSPRHISHLNSKWITKLLETIDFWVHNYRTRIYSVVLVVIVVSVIGMMKIKTLGFVVDDLPQDDPIFVDMKFFESKIHGVLPLEIIIDTKKPNGVFDPPTLYKINRLRKLLSNYSEFSKPLSVVEGIKFIYQSYRGDPRFYLLPAGLELSKLTEYSTTADNEKDSFRSFVDSNKQVTRMSVQMADVGSIRMKELLAELQPRIDSIFNPSKYEVNITGSSLMFLKGNDYLLKNLKESVGLAIFLVAIMMFMLFMSTRMISISILPSLIPLLITAGLMGYFGIALKPSTILIFSIAFGISSDGTIYFLTKYRQELGNHDNNISRTVSAAIRETGVSMVYTAVILFSGFFIFVASGFGGTVALGTLISFTLLVAMCSNLILLPSFLVSLEKKMTTKNFLSEPLIEVYEEEEEEAEQEENENTKKKK